MADLSLIKDDRLRYVYSTHKSQRSAELALDDYLASGEVSEGEHPIIRHRGSRWLIEIES